MNKIKETIKNSKFWIFVLVAIAFFGIFTKMDYATDTYCVFGTPAKQMIEHFIKSGRFITALSQAILTLLNTGNTVAYTLSFFIAIVCTIFSIYKIYIIFEKDISSKLIAGIVAIAIIINAFSIELYLFLEKGILMLSVFLSVLAFEKMVTFFEDKNKVKSIILAFIYMVLANFSYQGTVALFVVLCSIYIVKYTKNIKSFIVNNIATAICYGIPALINYLTVKIIFKNSRVSGEYNLLLSIKKILSNTKDMFIYTYKILPQYMFILVLGIIALISIICIITKKESIKKRTLLILGLIYVMLATLVVTIFPQIMQSTDSIGFAPRSTYAFASILGIIVVYTFMNANVNKVIEKLLIVVLVCYLLVQYVSFTNIERDRYIVNYMDYYQFLQIQEIVNEYETETGNVITKIATYQNEPEGTYPNIFISGDINIKATCPTWSRIDYLEYYFGRTLQEVEQSEEVYNEYFKDKQWNYFDNEQVVLIDDTLHLYIY